MTSLSTAAFALPDHLAAKADPALIASRRAALRGDRGEPRPVDRRPVRPPRRRAQGARRHRPGGAGPRPGGPPADRPAAHPAPLRPGPVPGPHRRARTTREPVYVGRLGLTDSDGPSAAGRLALPRGRAVLRRDPRQPDGPGQPPPVPLDPRPDHRLLGRGVHRRTGSRGTPRSTTSPRSSPASAAAGRRGCATCSAPSRPTRTRSSARAPAAPSSSTAARAPARPSSRCTARRTCSTPTRGSGTAAAACCSSGRTSPYLAYVADVLPSLGEEGVQTCTLRDLVPEGATAAVEPDPEVARLKSSAEHGDARSSRPSGSTRSRRRKGMVVETHWADVWLSAADWAEAFEAPDPGTPHNEARDQVWEELLTILVDKHDDEDVPTPTCSGGRCSRTGSWPTAFNRAWPLLEADRPRRRPVVGAGLPAQVRALAQPGRGAGAAAAETPQAWTVSDLPLLDAARQRLGDPEASRRRRRQRGRRRRRARARWTGSSTT